MNREDGLKNYRVKSSVASDLMASRSMTKKESLKQSVVIAGLIQSNAFLKASSQIE